MQMINNGTVSFHEELCIENVTLVVIKFLKALPESILSSELFPAFKQSIDIEDEDQKNTKLKQLFEQLPFCNRETVHCLAKHFILVVKHADTNLMNRESFITTLKIIFGPTTARVFDQLIFNISLCPSTITFGIPLEDAALLDKTGLIPSPIRLAIEHIENNNLWGDDLYISSGSWIIINRFKDKFNRGEPISFDDVDDVDIVTGLVKLYIHDIPFNMFTSQLKPRFMEVAEMVLEEQLPILKNLINMLPPPQYTTAKFLVTHLRRVCDNSGGAINPGHIGAVFGGAYRTIFPVVIPHCNELF